MPNPPQVIVIAGPNWAGKSTAASQILPTGMPFINADEIAKGLPDYPFPGADIQAGRLVLEQMDDLGEKRLGFAVETTLSGRTLAPRIARLQSLGFEFQLIFNFLPDPDLAVQRVAERVRRGGHNIPEQTIRRRFHLGINNFFRLYQPLADRRRVYDTSSFGPPRIIADGTMGGETRIVDSTSWQLMQLEAQDE